MNQVFFVVNEAQKLLVANLNHPQLTISLNYNNFTPNAFNIVIDATTQWQQNINDTNKHLTWLVHEPCVLNNNIEYNVIRFNAWPTFFENKSWEFSGKLSEAVKTSIEAITNKILIESADIVGLISGNIVANIINEAYNTLSQNISTKAAIDTAMKLGTNYPYGPFEWAEKIGIENIKTLLVAIAQQNNSYKVNPLIV